MIIRDDKEQEGHRFGIGEWYGRSFIRLTPKERKRFSEFQAVARSLLPKELCPPASSPDKSIRCTKEDGICSIRLFRKTPGDNTSVVEGRAGQLRTACCYRFQQNGTIFRWIGETILEHSEPLVIGEIAFLGPSTDEQKDVGTDIKSEAAERINILVHPTRRPLSWCALEVQPSYISDSSMGWEAFSAAGNTLACPADQGRSDRRSSAPKQLMSELQMKVPSLRRWGKKMAVVVDEDFVPGLGRMDTVKHLSNCDVAWFVVRYDESQGEAVLQPSFVHLTTLEGAVEGLSTGSPGHLETFEAGILKNYECFLTP